MSKGKYQTLELKPTQFPPYKGRDFTPLKSLVHVQLDRQPDVIKFDDRRDPLVLSGAYKAKCQLCQAKVLSFGPDVQDIQVGDVVLVEQHLGSGNDGRVRVDGTMFIERKHVVCVVEARP